MIKAPSTFCSHYLRDDKNCLSDLNLAAHNIRVDTRLDQCITSIGILDFNSARFAPTFVRLLLPISIAPARLIHIRAMLKRMKAQ